MNIAENASELLPEKVLVSLCIFSKNLFLLHSGFVENHHNVPIASTEFQTLFCLPKPANISDCFLPCGRDGAQKRRLENPWLLLKGWGAGEDAARRDEGAWGC